MRNNEKAAYEEQEFLNEDEKILIRKKKQQRRITAEELEFWDKEGDTEIKETDKDEAEAAEDDWWDSWGNSVD